MEMTTITLPRAVVEQALEVMEHSLTFVVIEAKRAVRNDCADATIREAETAAHQHRVAITALRATVEQEQAEPLTIERLRYALVASRIIDPAAVEDPDEYDDGVTLHRIEALHRRLT